MLTTGRLLPEAFCRRTFPSVADRQQERLPESLISSLAGGRRRPFAPARMLVASRCCTNREIAKPAGHPATMSHRDRSCHNLYWCWSFRFIFGVIPKGNTMYEVVYSLGRSVGISHSTIQEVLLAIPLVVLMVAALAVIGSICWIMLRSCAVFVATQVPRVRRLRLVAR